MAASRTDQLNEALNLWTQGNQQGATEILRPMADAGEPAAVGLIAWFFQQMGEPHWRQGIPYAEKAIAMGMPWVANYYFGNMLNDAALRPGIPDFLRPAIASGLQVDPIAHAIGPYQQGDPATAMAMIDLATGPWPWPEGWRQLMDEARNKLNELDAASGVVSDRRDSALEAISNDEARVSDRAATLDTRTQQLETLLEQTTNAEVQTFFDKEATAYETEAKSLWKWGVRVLAGAATFAVLPILLFYVGQVIGEDWFADQNLVAAHFAPAIALGAVAGVLLARARGRDHARQRARDLSVALGTMFVYSGQIVQEEERQRFVHDMGRTVIESFLRQETSTSDGDSGGLLSALARRS